MMGSGMNQQSQPEVSLEPFLDASSFFSPWN